MTEQAWEAFEYEVEMFFETRSRIPGADDRIAKNALVESALLHTRILVDTLLSKPRELDDITLKGALPSTQWPDGLKAALEQLAAKYGLRNQEGLPCWTLNKRLAHLTAKRGPSWEYAPLLRELDPLIASVLAKVLPCLSRPALVRYADQCVAAQTRQTG
jgi:hypothetical protein